MEKIKVGFITMTHGLKGELKFFCDFSKKDLILKKGFPIYIQGKLHTLTHVRTHKNHYLITIDGLEDINLVEDFRKKDVFVNILDIPLLDGDVIVESLIQYEIYDVEEILGKVVDIMYNGGGILFKISGRKDFYIPYNDYFVKKILSKDKKIITMNAKDLML